VLLEVTVPPCDLSRSALCAYQDPGGGGGGEGRAGGGGIGVGGGGAGGNGGGCGFKDGVW